MEQEFLKSILDYNEETGVFLWKVSRGCIRKGEEAGNTRPDGYYRIRIENKPYFAHRLAWLYIHGKFPDNHIDHINGDTSDNRLSNLREATNQQNQYNVTKLRCDNSTGYKGVSFNKRDNKFQAQIRINGKLIFLGYFDSAKKAGAAYERAAKNFHGEFYRKIS